MVVLPKGKLAVIDGLEGYLIAESNNVLLICRKDEEHAKKYGEAVGAFIILQEGVTIQAEDVRDFCRNKISRYKIPKYIFFVDEFPMTGSGKIQKFRLKDLGLKLCKEQGIEII